MPALKVREGMFAGSGQLYGKGGLDSLIRGIAVDNARLRLMVAQVPDLTDNSTGAASSLKDLNDNPAPFDASSAGGAGGDSFTDAVGKVSDLQKTLTNSVNKARTMVGLPLVSAPDGNQATADTLPALAKTVTTASGAQVASIGSARNAMRVLKANQRKLVRAMEEVLVAVGEPKFKSPFKGSVKSDLTLDAKPTLSATPNGKNGASKASVDAFLTTLANNYATLAAAWNSAMTQGTTPKPLSVVAG